LLFVLGSRISGCSLHECPKCPCLPSNGHPRRSNANASPVTSASHRRSRPSAYHFNIYHCHPLQSPPKTCLSQDPYTVPNFIHFMKYIFSSLKDFYSSYVKLISPQLLCPQKSLERNRSNQPYKQSSDTLLDEVSFPSSRYHFNKNI
jgi:hypothetical protein